MIGHVQVNEKELALLRRKAEAHDAYLAAWRVMSERQATYLPLREGRQVFYADGWLDCFREFSESVLAAAQENAPVRVPEYVERYGDLPF